MKGAVLLLRSGSETGLHGGRAVLEPWGTEGRCRVHLASRVTASKGSRVQNGWTSGNPAAEERAGGGGGGRVCGKQSAFYFQERDGWGGEGQEKGGALGQGGEADGSKPRDCRSHPGNGIPPPDK